MFIQILLLEDTHADGVTVFAVNEELMNQLAFYSKLTDAVYCGR